MPWSHTSLIIYHNTFAKNLKAVHPKSFREEEQKVGDICMMNILSNVSSLPSLLAIDFMKMDI